MLPMLAIVAEVNPITEHLVLLIIAVALAGALLLVVLLAVIFWGSIRRSLRTLGHEPEPTKTTEPSQNPFGDPD
jgi:hypothetical protein